MHEPVAADSLVIVQLHSHAAGWTKKGKVALVLLCWLMLFFGRPKDCKLVGLGRVLCVCLCLGYVCLGRLDGPICGQVDTECVCVGVGT